MPIIVKPPTMPVTFKARPLSQGAFGTFGTVIENPEPTLEPSPDLEHLPANAVLANQGSAIKYIDVTDMVDLYGSAPSEVPSKAVMNMFVCGPRALHTTTDEELLGYFEVEILERHPFTTQTFIPLGLSRAEQRQAYYLVIVAPSLELSSEDRHLPGPIPSSTVEVRHRGGFPDLTKIQAFIAKGSQAVTYGAGTWHAPMVVIGKQVVDFVVVQFSNGVAIEDCQEVSFKSATAHLRIAVPKMRFKGVPKL